MMTFAEELAHVARAIPGVRVLPWGPDAKAAFLDIMTRKDGWRYRAWKEKNLPGTPEEQVDAWASTLDLASLAIWVSNADLVRVYQRYSIPDVHVIFGAATRLDYDNIDDHRALWDIGVRRITIFADSSWAYYYTNIQRRGYVDDAEQPEGLAPGVVRMTKRLDDHP